MAENSVVETSGKGNLCPILQRKANKALKLLSFDPTHHSDFGHYVTSHIHRSLDPLSRALLTMILQRKIRAKKPGQQIPQAWKTPY